MLPYFFFFFAILTCVNAATPASAFKQADIFDSPLNDIRIECYIDDDNDSKTAWIRQIWLSWMHNPKEKVLLFQHERSADVVMSPDESSLVINDRLASNESIVRLFKREKGLHYRELTDLNLDQKIWKKAAKIGHFNLSLLDHIYCNCNEWQNNHSIRLVINGMGSLRSHPSFYVESWYCTYDLKTGKIEFDSFKPDAKPFGILKQDS